jgi:hypothetical protein
MAAFNIDPDFGGALDGLVVVDLRRSDPKLLQRFHGRGRVADLRLLPWVGSGRRSGNSFPRHRISAHFPERDSRLNACSARSAAERSQSVQERSSRSGPRPLV